MFNSEIVEGIKTHGCKSIEEIGYAIEAGAVCGSCHDDLQEILDEVNG
jgi:NAD(P)H-nitrite reductase large subunit